MTMMMMMTGSVAVTADEWDFRVVESPFVVPDCAESVSVTSSTVGRTLDRTGRPKKVDSKFIRADNGLTTCLSWATSDFNNNNSHYNDYHLYPVDHLGCQIALKLQFLHNCWVG